MCSNISPGFEQWSPSTPPPQTNHRSRTNARELVLTFHRSCNACDTNSNNNARVCLYGRLISNGIVMAPSGIYSSIVSCNNYLFGIFYSFYILNDKASIRVFYSDFNFSPTIHPYYILKAGCPK